jgi:hypothetical protein
VRFGMYSVNDETERSWEKLRTRMFSLARLHIYR